MCRWMMKTEDATLCGAQCEVFSHGMLRVHFAPQNRIRTLEFAFDVMSFMQQLQRAQGHGEYRIVPNTVRREGQERQERCVCRSVTEFFVGRHEREQPHLALCVFGNVRCRTRRPV